MEYIYQYIGYDKISQGDRSITSEIYSTILNIKRRFNNIQDKMTI